MPKRSPHCFGLVPPTAISMVMFSTTVEMQASRLTRECIVQFVIVGPAKGLEPVKTLYTSIEAEDENKFNSLKGVEVD